MKRILLTASLFVALLVVAACGRSQEEPPSTPTDIPAVVEKIELEAEAVEEAEVATVESDDSEADVATEADAEAADEIEATAAQSAEITVLMNDLYFGETSDNLTNPPVWTVNKGQEVTLNMQNQSAAIEHNWVIVKQGAEISVPYNEKTDAESLLFESGLIPVESEQVATFTAPGVGEYLVICTVPGHSVVMQGKLVVE